MTPNICSLTANWSHELLLAAPAPNVTSSPSPSWWVGGAPGDAGESEGCQACNSRSREAFPLLISVSVRNAITEIATLVPLSGLEQGVQERQKATCQANWVGGLTVTVGQFSICWPRLPILDVGGSDEERLFQRSAWFRDLLDIFQSHTSRVAFWTSGQNDTLVTLTGFCRQCDSCTLMWNGSWRFVTRDTIGYVGRTVRPAKVWSTRSCGAS